MKHSAKRIMRNAIIMITFCMGLGSIEGFSQQTIDSQNFPRIIEFLGDQPMTRTGRTFPVSAIISNPSATLTMRFKVRLLTPEHVRVIDATDHIVILGPKKRTTIRWKIVADAPLYDKLQLEITRDDAIIAAAQLPVRFLPFMKQIRAAYIPKPVPVKRDSKLLVGAIYFPGWEANRPQMWDQELKHPERTPALGFYDQSNPEVADWETKWAVEHGIDFFVYDWYRDSVGGPVKQMLGSALKARFQSKFRSQMKFTILWVNQDWKTQGVANEADLMNNLLPFWIDNYFKRGSYLKVDNKPVLYIYRPLNLIKTLGSVKKVQDAFNKMRQACINAGFDGLWLLGEYREHDPKHLELMKEIGLDYTFAYCWYVSNSPAPRQAIDSQLKQIHETHDLNFLPQVVTVSQGWSGWQDEGTVWAIPPVEYEVLLRKAKAFVETLPKNQLGSKMILLDNWNEWSEGHYIAPCTEYGFGYLDAIRKVFSIAPPKHVDLIPGDIGMGGYSEAYREWLTKKYEEKHE